MNAPLKIGIVGISGYGGRELLRLVIGHPRFRLAYAAGESSAGQRLGQLFPSLAGRSEADVIIAKFDPAETAELDVLFASLPTGKSREVLAKVESNVRCIDLGGDHRFLNGWTYGLTELPDHRDAIRVCKRLANPGCYPAAALLALMPLISRGLIDSEEIVIDAKSGITGTGRGEASSFGYVESSEDVFAYGLQQHSHASEIETVIGNLAKKRASVAFTPHVIPMKRGLLATCYAHPLKHLRVEDLHDAAQEMYRQEPFVRVIEDKSRGPRTSAVTASNLAHVSYAINDRTGLVVALGVVDNLGKGAAGQAVQNANLMAGLPEDTGLTSAPLLT